MSNPQETLLNALRKLKSQSDDGFEGLLRDLLEHLSGRRLWLVKSGPQGGMDVNSDNEAMLPGIAFEAKRFSAQTELPLDQLKAKLRDAISGSPRMDVWGLVTSREMKQPDLSELKAIGAAEGVSVICFDWRESAGSLPALGVLCAAGKHIAIARLGLKVEKAIAAMERHVDFPIIRAYLHRQITSPEIGFDLASEHVRSWFQKAISSRPLARELLRSDADLTSPNSRFVERCQVTEALRDWWGTQSNVPCVLLGQEGRGKSWAALAWCRALSMDDAAMMVLAISAKDLVGADVTEVIANALHRISPAIQPADWLRRVRRWSLRKTGGPQILILVDGMNEAWQLRWPDLVRSFTLEPWRGFIGLVLTCRSSFWRDDLLSLGGIGDKPIVEIPVVEYSDAELDAYLASFELHRKDFSPGLLNLIRVPRFAELAISLRETLANSAELTVAHLILEDWRDRLRKNSDLRVDDEGLREFVAGLGKEAGAKLDFIVTQQEVYKRLAQDSGYDLAHYRATISDIVSGLWFQPTARPHRYLVNERLLPFAVALHLVSSISELDDRQAIQAIIAKSVEHFRGADIAVSILRATASLLFIQRTGTQSSREAIIRAWISEQNFSGIDFEEFWRLIIYDSALFLQIAQDYLARRPVGSAQNEALAKGFANAAKWPSVMALLVNTLPMWAGAFGRDPLHWAHPTILENPVTIQQTQQRVADLAATTDAEVSEIVSFLRVDAQDHLSEAAIAIISFLPRTPFMKTLITWAMTRALMGDFVERRSFDWLLRLNTEDPVAFDLEFERVAARWRRINSELASRTIEIVAEALTGMSTPHLTAKKERRRAARTFPDSARIDRQNVIKWTGERRDGKDTGDHVRNISSLIPFAAEPELDLAPSIIDWLLKTLKSDDGATSKVFRKIMGDEAIVYARWAPQGFGACVRAEIDHRLQENHDLPDEFFRNLATLSILFTDRDVGSLRSFLFAQIEALPPDDDRGTLLKRHRYQNLVVLTLIGLPAAEQLDHLRRMLPNWMFERRIADRLATPSSGELLTIEEGLANSTSSMERMSLLEYLYHTAPDKLPERLRTMLFQLCEDEDVAVRSKALEIASRCGDSELGRRVAEGRWSYGSGKSHEEIASGTYILAKYGKHLDLCTLRKRIAPQALAFFVDQRGRLKHEVELLLSDLLKALDDLISRRIRSYTIHSIGFRVDQELWLRVIEVGGQPLAAKIYEAAQRGHMGIYFAESVPISSILRALMIVRPKHGAEIWRIIREYHRKNGFTIGDFELLPFEAPDSDETCKLREEQIASAKDDESLFESAYIAQQSGRLSWLIGFVHDLLSGPSSGRVACGITLAGFLDSTEAARALWSGRIDRLRLDGWLSNVRSISKKRFRENGQARHWFRQFLLSNNSDAAWGFWQLYTHCRDDRVGLWAQDMIDQAADKLSEPFAAYVDLMAKENREEKKRKRDDRKRVLFGTPTSPNVLPWL